MTEERNHLSAIQDICTGPVEEPDTELVLGNIYGLREWFIYSSADYYGRNDLPPDMRLIGHFGQVWEPTEELIGDCRAGNLHHKWSADIDGAQDAEDIEYSIRDSISTWLSNDAIAYANVDFATARAYLSFSTDGPFTDAWRPADWLLDDPFQPTKRVQIPIDFMRRYTETGRGSFTFRLVGKPREHKVGYPSCTCGIYAYHSKDSLRVSAPYERAVWGTAYGLIQASGFVTVGTKGFRAEKAKTVAMTLPQYCDLPDDVTAPVIQQWKDHGITVLPDLPALVAFAEHGGFLEKPENLKPATG